MLSVTVHKDIGEYTEKVVGKLSARTLACTAGGLAASVAAAAAARRRLLEPGGAVRVKAVGFAGVDLPELRVLGDEGGQLLVGDAAVVA